MAWIIDRYRDSSTWAGFSGATRKQRDAIFRQIIMTAGHEPLSRMTKAAIIAGRDRRKTTPNQARHYLDAMRGLCRWAFESGLIKSDPTEGVRPPRTKRSAGFPAWTADDVAAFERRWPIGTRERVAFDVLRFTGLRRGDAAMLGRQHIRDGVITFRTTKTGETVYVALQPELAATITAGPCGDLAFITGPTGKQLTKESFGNWFRDVCRSAGVDKSAHGLRKWFATMLADGGATVSELQAACGWTSGRMALHYTQAADRKRLGLSGTRRLTENANRT